MAFILFLATFAGMQQTIKDVIFDFGGVLTDFDQQACIHAFKRIGATSAVSYVQEHRTEDMFLVIETGRMSTHEFCDAIRRSSPGCLASDDEIEQAWNTLLKGIPVNRLRTVADIHGSFPTFLLSNISQMHWTKAQNHLLTADGHIAGYYFDNTFLSYEMGVMKPDTRIYTAVLNQTGMDAGRTLFVDDNEANCRAAQSLGIQAMHAVGDEWIGKLEWL